MNRRIMRALTAFCIALCAGAAMAGGSMQVGSPAPAYEAESLQGGAVTLESLRGRVVLLNVWATWCPSCRDEIPFLAKLHSTESARGLAVVGISIDDASDRQQVVNALPALGINYPVWLDPEDRIGRLHRSKGLPASVLIDRAGVVRWRHEGILRASTPGFREALSASLAAPAPDVVMKPAVPG
jgi:thiol-disulfide isomerase/thioredoxin